MWVELISVSLVKYNIYIYIYELKVNVREHSTHFWNTVAFFQIPPWPTTGLTFEVAVTSCRQEIEAKLALGMCGNVVSAQLTAAIDTCVEDVQVREVCLRGREQKKLNGAECNTLRTSCQHWKTRSHALSFCDCVEPMHSFFVIL